MQCGKLAVMPDATHVFWSLLLCLFFLCEEVQGDSGRNHRATYDRYAQAFTDAYVAESTVATEDQSGEVEADRLGSPRDQETSLQTTIEKHDDGKQPVTRKPESFTPESRSSEKKAQTSQTGPGTAPANSAPATGASSRKETPPPTQVSRQPTRDSSRPADAGVHLTKAEAQSSAPVKSSSLIQLLEGREDELKLWLGIAVTFFIVGWISGGNYYIWRDRKRSRKLKF